MEIIGSLAGPIIGGLMGGKESGQQQQQKQELDPRMQKLIYGDGSGGGLLNDTDALRRQQMAQGGLNPMQRGGLEMQRQTLMSPQYTQGYDQMRNMGSQLMGAGVTGNPFANGGNGQIGGGMGRSSMPTPMAAQGQSGQQMQPFQYQQNEAMQGMNLPMSAYQPPAAPAATNPEDSMTPLQRILSQMAQEQAGSNGSAGMGSRGYGGGR